MFVYKTAKEFEALTEYQQEKYLDEKRKHEEALNKAASEKSAKEAVDAMKSELESANKVLIDALKAENKEALDALSAENKTKLEEVEAAMKRAKIGESKLRMKGFSDHIIEKLSTEEGEKMIKAFFAGHKSEFKVQIGEDTDKSLDDTIKALGVPAGGVAPEFTPIVGPGHDEFHARNIVPVFPTISNAIKFIQYVVDGAAAGFGTVAVGAQKPTVGYTPSVLTANVRKIAGLLDVPDELLDDVVGFRAWIAYELPKAYMDAEDLQIYKGDGTGENILGLWYQASAQSFPQGSVTAAASNTMDKIVAGITQVRKLKRATSAVVISPVAWQEILINKGTTKEYTYPIVLDANGVMRIGGVPIFWSNVFADSEGLVGDFARGTAIFQRKAMQIGYFDQNKDNVEKNVVTIRLEGRIALPIFYPESFKRLLLTVTT